MLYVREAVPQDPVALAPKLREEDKAECRAASGDNPHEALHRAYINSSIAKAIAMGPPKGNHEVVALYGVVSVDPSVGLGGVWLLGSDRLVDDGVRFARQCVHYIEALHERYPALFNFVDARNALHIRWLKWAGFSFIQYHDKFGYEQRPFYEFVRMQR